MLELLDGSKCAWGQTSSTVPKNGWFQNGFRSEQVSRSNLSGKTWKNHEKSLNVSDPENISSLALEALNRTMEGPVPDVDFSAFCVEIPGPMEVTTVTTRQREVGKQLYEILTNHGDWPLICGV